MATMSDLKILSLRVSEKSEWLFLKLTCSDGFIGFGEMTMEGHEEAVKTAASRLAEEVKGLKAFSPIQTQQLCMEAQGGADRFAVLSALDQAQWDAEGKRCGQPVAAILGGACQKPRLYANINRGITDRSPDGFAAAAQKAINAGFNAIKIAPFDGLDWSKGRDDEQIRLYRDGLSRIEACRTAIGQVAELLVDCHWRFDPETANALIADITPFNLYWLECPIPETEAALPTIIRLRDVCNQAGILLAGLEMGNGLAAFLPYLQAGALDVIMPDVKYAGGLTQSRSIAEEAQRYGVICSPHNPTGPICHAASLQLAATLPNCPILEHQFQETPLFDSIVQHAFMPPDNGLVALPSGPGLGVTLCLP